jgi:hypothetical protein
MDSYSDSDTSSESEYESDQGSIHGSNYDDDEDLEPELSTTTYDDDYHSQSTIETELQAQHDAALLAQLHADIKGRAELPDPTYPKLLRSWPARPFDVRILPNFIQHPIHYFELFWGPEVWNTLVENTNAYAQYKETQHKESKSEKRLRWWKAITLYKMHIFIALLIYIGIVGTSNIASYWDKSGITIHKPMESITYFRFQQIKWYFHVSPPISSHLPMTRWYTKLDPLASLLRTKFKAYVILGQDISFDEMMVPFAGRSKHTLKMKNKLVKEGFKI